jgi:hypothetical protein
MMLLLKKIKTLKMRLHVTSNSLKTLRLDFKKSWMPFKLRLMGVRTSLPSLQLCRPTTMS